MNWDQIKGKWSVYKGEIKQRWGKLTDDDLKVIEGKRDVLAGKIQERYGIAKEQVETEIKEFEKLRKAVASTDARTTTLSKPHPKE